MRADEDYAAPLAAFGIEQGVQGIGVAEWMQVHDNVLLTMQCAYSMPGGAAAKLLKMLVGKRALQVFWTKLQGLRAIA